MNIEKRSVSIKDNITSTTVTSTSEDWDHDKTNKKQTEGMEANKGFLARWGYRVALGIVAVIGVLFSVLGRC